MSASVTTNNTYSTPTSIHLKRGHPDAPSYPNPISQSTIRQPATENTSNQKSLPPLPSISSQYILQVYTHKSLRRPDVTSPEEFEDSQRLAVLGEKVFGAVVAIVLFKRRPLLTFERLKQLSKEFVSDTYIDTWVTAYKLRDKVRCTPNVYDQLNTPEETKLLFYAFVGGVYAGSGMRAVEDWIDPLLETHVNDDPTSETSGPPPTYRPSTPPSKRAKSEAPPTSTPAQSTIFFASQPPSQPPKQSNFMAAYIKSYGSVTNTGNLQPFQAQQFPQTPSFPPINGNYNWTQPLQTQTPFQSRPDAVANPLAPAQPSLAFLPLFNQTAAQRKVKVDYQAQFSGPSHAGRWHVECVVNGITKGRGAGITKQTAKEEAARQAYYAMGWT